MRSASAPRAKHRDSAHPQTVEPGQWTVILEPAAFGELFSYLVDHFSAQSYEEGSSFLERWARDRQYLGENVTIGDDYAHPLNPGMPFDYEGQPTSAHCRSSKTASRENIVTDSVLRQRNSERENTGHALPAPNAYGPQALHTWSSLREASRFNELISETKRGLLVTRFWYIRTVDQKRRSSPE